MAANGSRLFIFLENVQMTFSNQTIIEPRHEIFKYDVCATSKASDQPAHTGSLIRAFASRLTLSMLGNFSCLACHLLTFFKINFSKNSFRNTIGVSNDLGPNCLQRLSLDNKFRRWQANRPPVCNCIKMNGIVLLI